MFEQGTALKQKHGEDKVFDFSLGNPDISPPIEFTKTIQELLANDEPAKHGYMPNAGFPDVRESLAHMVNQEYSCSLTADHIIMTVGAAGGMNTVLKTILDPGDEVIIIKPYFVEYNFYITNHQGVPVAVNSTDTFSLDLQAVEQAITKKTRAVIINSPNNPTGRIYPQQEIEGLAQLLGKHSSTRTIYLISDEPYRQIVYDKKTVPSVLAAYENSMVVYSWSKTLSIPGERIGYIAVSSRTKEVEILLAGLVLSNRILGYVNAPALMQRTVAALKNVTVDMDIYTRRMETFTQGLEQCGYEFIKPEGAFYLFVKTPGGDDVAFVNHLQEYNILAVPGTGFGGPGYMRLAFCVPEDVIDRSLPRFRQAKDEFKG